MCWLPFFVLGGGGGRINWMSGSWMSKAALGLSWVIESGNRDASCVGRCT